MLLLPNKQSIGCSEITVCLLTIVLADYKLFYIVNGTIVSAFSISQVSMSTCKFKIMTQYKHYNTVKTPSHWLSIANLLVNDEQSILGNNKVSWNSPILSENKVFCNVLSMAATSQTQMFSLFELEWNEHGLSPQFPFKCAFETGHPLDLLGTLASHGTLALRHSGQISH